ncbi:hypothetical protein [Bifidobacterium sp. SO1]|uniref:hypothetical protein n=1 Tax=Bifidobacterium sp. SO1 TaxID=2809029 RepID=UPI001BDC8E43|nr:hypothetical protein [Bifidobacterium sp. SO1]MBT1161273.1 hypothetical protein [Bifidobacterium sp. SO1]
METKHETTYSEMTFTATVKPGSGLSDLMKDIFIGRIPSDDPSPLSDERTNERIDHIEDVKPGDLLSIGKRLTTVNGIVTLVTQCPEDDGLLHVWFENMTPGYCVGEDENSWQLRSCYRPLGHTEEDGPQAAEDDEPAMLRITDIHDLRQGDRVHLHKGETKVEGVYDAMRSGELYEAQGVSIKFVDDPRFLEGYDARYEPNGFSYVFDYAERRPYDSWTQDDLPKEPGFYRAATGSVWKFDGKLYAPVLDSEGKLAPATGTPTVGAGTFLKRSLAAHRFPFARVSMNVGMYYPEADE